MIKDNESQPNYQPKPSKQRSNVSAYALWEPKEKLAENKDQLMMNVAKGLHSQEFENFVRLVGKEAATNYLRRMLQNKKEG